MLRSVLVDVPRGEGEIPFAVDDQGRVLAAEPAEAARLEALALSAFLKRGDPTFFRDGFVVVAQRDADLGYSFGIARPVGEAVGQIRSTALRNLGLGLGLVALALLGILPFSRRITRDLEALEDGAERLAAGDLSARVAVGSKDEIGRLALAFNRMAEDLGLLQERRLAEEGLRRELLTCRRIQTDSAPWPPRHPHRARRRRFVSGARGGRRLLQLLPPPRGRLACSWATSRAKASPPRC